jgi:hypothetical protein
MLEKFAAKGVRSFPKSPFFHFQVGELEMRAGPLGCDRQLARRSFTKAAQYAEGSSDPEVALIRDLAQRRLTFLGEVDKAPPFPFPDDFGFFDGGGFEDEDYYDDEADDWLDAPSPEEAADIAELARDPLMREVIANMASQMGLDPQQVFDYLDQGELPPMAPPGLGPSGPSRKKKRKKKKRK